MIRTAMNQSVHISRNLCQSDINTGSHMWKYFMFLYTQVLVYTHMKQCPGPLTTASTSILVFNAILQWKEPGILGGMAGSSTWVVNIQKYNLDVMLENKKVLKIKTKPHIGGGMSKEYRSPLKAPHGRSNSVSEVSLDCSPKCKRNILESTVL